MKPIIEIQSRTRPGRRNSYRDWLILRHPVSGGVLARQMIGNTLTRTEIAERTKSFTEWGLDWFSKNFSDMKYPSFVRCDDILL